MVSVGYSDTQFLLWTGGIHTQSHQFQFEPALLLTDEEQNCEQASNTLHHINRANLFTEISAISRRRHQDILRVSPK